MAKPTNIASKVGPWALTRRGFERGKGFRLGCAAFWGGFAAIFFGCANGPVASTIGVVCVLATVAILVVPLWSPERTRRRLLSTARNALPEAEGLVTLTGVARESGELLKAPFSDRPCIAYWARTVDKEAEDDSSDAAFDDDNWVAVCDFAMDVESELLSIEGAQAVFAFDRSDAEVVPFKKAPIVPTTKAHQGKKRDEEVILCPGDRVVVRGMFVISDRDNPFRRSLQMVASPGHRVIVAAAESRHGNGKPD